MKVSKNTQIAIIVLGVLALILTPLFLVDNKRSKAYMKMQSYLAEKGPTEGVSPSLRDAYIAEIINPLEKRISYVLKKSKSGDPAVAITAYFILSELVRTRNNQGPEVQVHVDKIDPEELYKRFDEYDDSDLEDNWSGWLDTAHTSMKLSIDKRKQEELEGEEEEEYEEAE